MQLGQNCIQKVGWDDCILMWCSHDPAYLPVYGVEVGVSWPQLQQVGELAEAVLES